jgi:tetratricopeptide (TPR) repeat protein
VRAALGAGRLLRDDRPALEVLAARRRGEADREEVLALLVEVARAGAAEPGRSGAALLWLESLHARAAGATAQADSSEALAAAAGMPDAARARAGRRTVAAHADLEAGLVEAAERGFQEALALDPDQHQARFELAGLAIRRGDLDGAVAALEALLARWPDEPVARNELSSVLYRRGDLAAARRAAAGALETNPFYLAALANAGLLAGEDGDTAAAQALLARLRAVSPLGVSQEERALAAALSRRGND